MKKLGIIALIVVSIMLVSFGAVNVNAVTCAGSGGTLTYDGDYCVHKFTTNSTFNISSTGVNASVLVVAGGGSGEEQSKCGGCKGKSNDVPSIKMGQKMGTADNGIRTTRKIILFESRITSKNKTEINVN